MGAVGLCNHHDVSSLAKSGHVPDVVTVIVPQDYLGPRQPASLPGDFTHGAGRVGIDGGLSISRLVRGRVEKQAVSFKGILPHVGVEQNLPARIGSIDGRETAELLQRLRRVVGRCQDRLHLVQCAGIDASRLVSSLAAGKKAELLLRSEVQFGKVERNRANSAAPERPRLERAISTCFVPAKHGEI